MLQGKIENMSGLFFFSSLNALCVGLTAYMKTCRTHAAGLWAEGFKKLLSNSLASFKVGVCGAACSSK